MSRLSEVGSTNALAALVGMPLGELLRSESTEGFFAEMFKSTSLDDLAVASMGTPTVGSRRLALPSPIRRGEGMISSFSSCSLNMAVALGGV